MHAGERVVVRRHGVEIMGCVMLAALLDMCITAAVGNALGAHTAPSFFSSPRPSTSLTQASTSSHTPPHPPQPPGLSPDLTLAIAPRTVTVALAVPIVGMLGASANAGVTAAIVVVTGLLGANFGQLLLTKLARAVAVPLSRRHSDVTLSQLFFACGSSRSRRYTRRATTTPW